MDAMLLSACRESYPDLDSKSDADLRAMLGDLDAQLIEAYHNPANHEPPSELPAIVDEIKEQMEYINYILSSRN